MQPQGIARVPEVILCLSTSNTSICKAIIPSHACTFAVTPCTKADFIVCDTMIGNVIKHKFELWKSTPTAMIREDTLNFGLGAPSICVEYHRCLATTALTSSLVDPSIRHCTTTLNLVIKQVAPHLWSHQRVPEHKGRNQPTYHVTIELLYVPVVSHKQSLKQTPPYETQGERKIRSISLEIRTINEDLSLRKPPPHTLSTLITCATKPLLSLWRKWAP